jgi:magnesium chelatase family protein
LEALRQPLEERVVRISRVSGTLEPPSDFLLVGCANPCPCGRIERECRCSDAHRMRYARRLSAPLLDRFDLRLRIEAPSDEVGAPSAQVRGTVETALERQRHRLAGTSWRRNAHIPAGALAARVPLSGDAHSAWVDACRLRRLTGRGAARIRRVARTLADLDDREHVSADDVVRASWLREDVW